MKWLTLTLVKQQLRIDTDLEDELLCLYADSAEDTVLHICDRSYDEVMTLFGEIPPKLIQASLLLVAISYKERSPISPQNYSAVPYGNIDFLLRPYMKL